MTIKSQKSTLILLNGDLDASLDLVRQNEFDITLATDGALNALEHKGWFPDIVLGDFDSVRPDLLELAKQHGTRIVPAPDQDHTDFEKALQHLEATAVKEITIIGHAGRRLDHTLGALYSAGRFTARYQFHFIDQVGDGWLVDPSEPYSLHNLSGHHCSVIGLVPASVSLDGFRWNVEQFQMGGHAPQGISNEIVNRAATVTVHDGVAFVYVHRRPGKLKP